MSIPVLRFGSGRWRDEAQFERLPTSITDFEVFNIESGPSVLTQFAAVLVFIVLGVIFVYGNLLLGSLARPKKPTRDKNTVYECGEPTIGSAWVRYNSRFYTIALVYLLFDVEVVVLLPAGLVLREMTGLGYGWTALLGILVFVAVLILGLAYEWFYGNLDWAGQAEESRQSRELAVMETRTPPPGPIHLGNVPPAA